MTNDNDNDYALHLILMRIMKFILFLHIIQEILLCFFEGCVVAGLLKISTNSVRHHFQTILI